MLLRCCCWFLSRSCIGWLLCSPLYNYSTLCPHSSSKCGQGAVTSYSKAVAMTACYMFKTNFNCITISTLSSFFLRPNVVWTGPECVCSCFALFSSPDPDRIEEKRKRKGDWLNRVMPSSGTGIVLNLHRIMNEHTPLVRAGEIKGGWVGGRWKACESVVR